MVDNTKKLRWRIDLLALGAILGLLLAEILLRILGLSDPFFYEYDKYTGVKLHSGVRGVFRREGEAHITVNNNGFRDREHSVSKPENTFRIAVLGDSYAEAMQVPVTETFWALLEKKLNQNHCFDEKTVEIMNFGVSGYGTAQDLLILRHYAGAYSPDLVLVAFCTGNDIRNNSRELEPRKGRPFFVFNGDHLKLDDSFRKDFVYQLRSRCLWPVVRISRVLQLLVKASETRQWRWKEAEAERKRFEEAGLDNAIYDKPKNANWEEAWRISEALLLELNKETKGMNARLLVVTLSNGIQVHPHKNKRERFRENLGVDDLFYPERRIKAFGDNHRIDVLNLAPLFQVYAEQQNIFLHGFDNQKLGFGHWNREGHALAAESIADYLCAKGAETSW